MPSRTHIPRSNTVWLAAALLCWAAACNRLDPCGAPGIVKICTCGDATQGARICTSDKTWGACDCSGAIPLPKPGGANPGSGGTHAGSGTGGHGSVKPSSGSGGGGPQQRDGSAGTAPKSDAGSVGAGGSGGQDASIGQGGGGGSGGAASEPVGAAYGGCASAADCQLDAQCIITSNYPLDASVCAPACVDLGDCPVPEGTYDAVLSCVGGYCQLDCTPVLFAELLSCPSGMTCVAPLLGNAYCHDDGM